MTLRLSEVRAPHRWGEGGAPWPGLHQGPAGGALLGPVGLSLSHGAPSTKCLRAQLRPCPPCVGGLRPRVVLQEGRLRTGPVFPTGPPAPELEPYKYSLTSALPLRPCRAL